MTSYPELMLCTGFSTGSSPVFSFNAFVKELWLQPYIYMPLVFSVTPKYHVKQKNHATNGIVKPRMSKIIPMFPKMGAVKKMSCGCGK